MQFHDIHDRKPPETTGNHRIAQNEETPSHQCFYW
nr:MAG TPA: hypothetical protein [Caudoviricetes sp.]